MLLDRDHRFVLGRCSCAVEDHDYTPAIEPESGDSIPSIAAWRAGQHRSISPAAARWAASAAGIYRNVTSIGTCRGRRRTVRGSIWLPVSSRIMRAGAAGSKSVRRVWRASTSGLRQDGRMHAGTRERVRKDAMTDFTSRAAIPAGEATGRTGCQGNPPRRLTTVSAEEEKSA